MAEPATIKVLLLFTIFSACQPASTYEFLPRSVSADTEFELEARIDRLIQETPLASLSLGIQVDHQPYFVEGYGITSIESGSKAEGNTLYQIGSITKTFTAVSIMQLVEKGRVELDRSVIDYIPELPPQAEGILIRHLLSHTSGLLDIEDTDIGINYSHSYEPDEIITLISREFPELSFEPGSKFHYSNLGFILLGFVIEEVSGRSYADYLAFNIFGPLKMESIAPCEEAKGAVAPGYKTYGNELVLADSSNLSLAYAAGGLCSSAKDLLIWYDGLSSGKVIDLDLYREMTSPVTLPDGTELETGMGFIVGDFLGARAIGHFGRMSGYESFLVHFTQEDLTVVVLCNSNPTNPYAISSLISSIREMIISS